MLLSIQQGLGFIPSSHCLSAPAGATSIMASVTSSSDARLQPHMPRHPCHPLSEHQLLRSWSHVHLLVVLFFMLGACWQPPGCSSVQPFFILLLFRAAPMAFRSSQARGRIEAAAEAYTTATAMPYPSHICTYTTPRGNWTCILMVTSWVLNPLSHNGNFFVCFFTISLIHIYQTLLCNYRCDKFIE